MVGSTKEELEKNGFSSSLSSYSFSPTASLTKVCDFSFSYRIITLFRSNNIKAFIYFYIPIQSSLYYEILTEYLKGK